MDFIQFDCEKNNFMLIFKDNKYSLVLRNINNLTHQK